LLMLSLNQRCEICGNIHSQIFTFLHNFSITMEMICKFTITLLASLSHRPAMLKISLLLLLISLISWVT
ncbi:hypothetical protein T12_5618, partial [Trichinella patagoniensis]